MHHKHVYQSAMYSPHALRDGLVAMRLDPFGVLLETVPHTHRFLDHGAIRNNLRLGNVWEHSITADVWRQNDKEYKA
jgi:hypothetical protein